eukprot:1804003-Pyramimonas_sp.AAC.1
MPTCLLTMPRSETRRYACSLPGQPPSAMQYAVSHPDSVRSECQVLRPMVHLKAALGCDVPARLAQDAVRMCDLLTSEKPVPAL